MENLTQKAETQTQYPSIQLEYKSFANLFDNLVQVPELDEGPVTAGHSFYRGTTEFQAATLNSSIKRHVSYYEDTDSVRSESFEVRLAEADASVTLIIFVAYSGQMGIASTNILKEDIYKKLPKGIGVHLYEFLFSLFNDIAHEREVSLVHEVTKGSVKNQTLENERWKQIFEPVLTKAGYEKQKNPDDLEAIEWSKTYYPD